MKKILFLALLMGCINSTFANFAAQGNWRWRKDDGSQTSATWLADQNTPIVVSSLDQTLRLRFELYRLSSTGDPGALTNAYFEVANTVDSVWKRVYVNPPAGSPFKLAGTSPNVTNLEATTMQLTTPHETTFQPGKMIVSSDSLPTDQVPPGSFTEYEWVIKPTADLQPSATYIFRVNAADYSHNNPYPTLTTAATLPIKLKDFSVSKESGKVRVNWTTASEENSQSFEVLRSGDGHQWSSVEKVVAHGTTSAEHNYTAYDKKPAAGVNYYRLKQSDVDGHVTMSEVKSIRISGLERVSVVVSPNPSRGVVNFKLDNTSATNVSVSLTNTNGKVVYQQVMKTVDAGTQYKLNLTQQPAPGLYILSIKAEGITENIKVIIQ